MNRVDLVAHNIIQYLWIQRKYRVLQISVFYFFAQLVLVFRICQYAYTLRLLNHFQTPETLFKILTADYAEEVYICRSIGIA